MDTPTAYALCLLKKLREAPTEATLYVACEEPEDIRSRLIKEGSSMIVQKSLVCGDYWYCVQTEKKGKEEKEEQLVYVVERKSLSDFNGGLDGRHKDQLYRLLHLPIPRHHVIYLIEYQDEKEIEHFKGYDVLVRELNEIHVRHGISFYWSAGKGLTLLYLVHLFQAVHLSKCQLEKGFFAVAEKLEDTGEQQVHIRSYPPVQTLFDFAKKGISKRGNETPEYLFLTQLRAIRGMGDSKAKAIAREYSSWSLLEALRLEVGDKAAIEELSNLSLDGKTKRRLGKAIAKKVVGCLTCSK